MGKAKEESSGGALATIEPSRFAILAPDNRIAEMIEMNLGGENMSEFDLDHVKVPAGGSTTWTIPGINGEEETKAIEGVLIYVARRRQYWASSDPSGDPPDCYSRDMETGTGNPGGECAVCPYNSFGTAKNERGKACKETRALFLVRTTDQLPIVVNCPPGSLGNIKKYMMRLAQSSVPYFQALTRLELAKVQNKDGIAYSEIRPSMAGKIADEALPKVREYAANLQKAFG